MLVAGVGVALTGRRADGAVGGHRAAIGVLMLPPYTSAIDGPLNTGHVQDASGNEAVPPPLTLTSIVPPVGVQVDAAQSAYWPWQIW
jgi:hypothetical protein